jgi:hypothetical protein
MSRINHVTYPENQIEMQPFQSLTFKSGISINCKTGEVILPDNLTLSESAKQFWKDVEASFPNLLRTEKIVDPKKGKTHKKVAVLHLRASKKLKKGTALVIYHSSKDGRLWASPATEFEHEKKDYVK